MSEITKQLILNNFPERHSVFRITESKCDKWSRVYQRLKPITKEGGIFLFLGKRGTGKTQMATTLSGYFLRDKKTVRYIKAYDIFSGIVESYHTGDSVVSKLIKSDVLVIDAVELRKGSEFENRELNHIIDKRYDGLELITIIISNDTQESIKAFLGDSTWSRVEQYGGVVTFDGKNFRERE